MELSDKARNAIIQAQHGNFNALGMSYPPTGTTIELLQHGLIELKSKQPIMGSNDIQMYAATYGLTPAGAAYQA